MVAMIRPYRHPKTGIFWLRKAIPQKLRPHFGGRREFKVTLRTREAKEAKLLASIRLLEFEDRLQEAAGVSAPILPHLVGFSRSLRDNSHLESHIYSQVTKETLLDVFEPWRREMQPKAKTTDEYRRSVQGFYNCVGVLSLSLIRTEHIRRYKDGLVNKGTLAAGSINKRLGAIKALLNFAKANGLIDVNPAEGIKVRRTKAVAQRHPFTNEEIVAIFSSPVFQSCHRPKAGAGEAAYWLPVIAYYTGARLEEIGQLCLEDVQEHEGVCFLEIADSHDELSKSVKTESGKRIIPLHPDLHRLGFIDFAAQWETQGRMFPALKANRYGTLTQNWSKWWSRYIKETVGIRENGKTFHAFRHTFAQLWKESGADLTIKDAVMGHSSGNNVQDRYGGWRNPKNGRMYLVSPKQMMNEIVKLSFGNSL